jgi:hypothetical protein
MVKYKHRYIVALFVFILSLNGCDTKYKYIELEMSEKNPISYVFNATIEQIHQALVSKYNNFPGISLEFASDSSIVWGSKYLNSPDNINDAFIWNYFPDTSIVYYNQQNKIPYYYSLHLHIIKIDNTKTEVEIITINPEIMTGIRFPSNVLSSVFHQPPITKSVHPSTIEEYRVLLNIGEVLGIKDKMPTMRVPKYPDKK